MIYVVMGVSGSGKTVIGQKLAERLGVPFHDADDFHPASNIAKMAAGTPLTDEDRWPWLRAMANAMRDWEKKGDAVLACSALKESYRQVLREGSERVLFLHLKGPRDLILQRMQARKGHFFPPGLLDSQLATLEEPADGLGVNVEAAPEAIVEDILRRLSVPGRNDGTGNREGSSSGK